MRAMVFPWATTLSLDATLRNDLVLSFLVENFFKDLAGKVC